LFLGCFLLVGLAGYARSQGAVIFSHALCSSRHASCIGDRCTPDFRPPLSRDRPLWKEPRVGFRIAENVAAHAADHRRIACELFRSARESDSRTRPGAAACTDRAFRKHQVRKKSCILEVARVPLECFTVCLEGILGLCVASSASGLLSPTATLTPSACSVSWQSQQKLILCSHARVSASMACSCFGRF
jgi:hypothetical protein